MMALIKFRVEDGLKALMQDEEFRRRIVVAYESQVEANHGWGFTVRYKGWKVRFDIVESGCKGLIIYEGYALEEPQGRQLSLLEVC